MVNGLLCYRLGSFVGNFLLVITYFLIALAPSLLRAEPTDRVVTFTNFSTALYGSVRLRTSCTGQNDVITTDVILGNANPLTLTSNPPLLESFLNRVRTNSMAFCEDEKEKTGTAADVPTSQVIKIMQSLSGGGPVLTASSKGGIWHTNLSWAAPTQTKSPSGADDVYVNPSQTGVQCFRLTILPTDAITVTMSSALERPPAFLTDSYTTKWLKAVEDYAIQWCRQHGVPDESLRRSNISVYLSAPSHLPLVSAEKQPGQSWRIQTNTVQREAREAAAAAQAQAAQNAQATMKQNARDAFIAKYGIVSWPSRSQLVANPFVMKGQIVAVYVAFLRMTSENDAVFGPPGCSPTNCDLALVVSKVPTSQFHVSQEDTILVLKVGGVRATSGVSRETGGAELEFVGSRPCALKNCTDFGDFTADGKLISAN